MQRNRFLTALTGLLMASVAFGAPPSVPPFKTSQINVDKVVDQAGTGAPKFETALDLKEIATPSGLSGYFRIYSKTDHNLYYRTNAGSEVQLTPALSNPLTTAGDIIYGGVAGAATRLAAGTSTQLLHSGTTPSWSAVSLTADVTGTLPVTNGGIGIASGTSGGIPYFSASTTVASSAALAANHVVVGGGAGTTPSTASATNIIGAGEGATPSATTLRGPAATGSNIAGASVTFDASNGTGTGGSGALIFRTAPVAASSSTANTFAEIMRVTPGGKVGVGTTAPGAVLTTRVASGASVGLLLTTNDGAASDQSVIEFNYSNGQSNNTGNLAKIVANASATGGTLKLQTAPGDSSAYATGLSITPQGYVTQPLNPSVQAFQNASQTGFSSPDTRVINYDGESYDVGGNYNPAGAPGIFTVPTGGAGKYLITANITVFNGTGVLNACTMDVRKNGTAFSRIFRESLGTSVTDHVIGGSTVMSLAAADTVTFIVGCTTVGNTGTWGIASDSSVHMSIEKIQ